LVKAQELLSPTNPVTFELFVTFLEAPPSSAFMAKERVCQWLVEHGRTEFVEGVIDGISDQISEVEQIQTFTTDERFETAPLAVYDRDLESLSNLSNSLRAAFSAFIKCQINELSTESWAQCWTESFEPWVSDRFIIFPLGTSPARQDELVGNKPTKLVSLEIDDRGGAFGTGQHRTTQCLLRLIESTWLEWQPESVLDVGCGTGILGLACGKLGAREVIGTEIDQDLVSLASENAVRHGVAMKVLLLEEPVGDFSDQGKLTPKFDLVIANILAPVLLSLMPTLRSQLRDQGRLLLAGFIAKERTHIIEKAEFEGLKLVHEVDEGGWCGLVLQINQNLKFA
ncbi:MAG: 50S ribosomal protein L11 methyltransferase, partial [Proteobacteria bacterium]|nr:50S ribosomal protein L11 methyltransferase [Pseudomonadota bacterium]